MLNRRPGIVSLLLLLAALSSPAGAARPLESLQLVVSISWVRGDHARIERRPATHVCPNCGTPPFSVRRFSRVRDRPPSRRGSFSVRRRQPSTRRNP